MGGQNNGLLLPAQVMYSEKKSSYRPWQASTYLNGVLAHSQCVPQLDGVVTSP